MRVVVRGNTGSLRGVTSFTFSACVHGAILGWVALGPSLPLEERPRSIYDQQIRPNEKKIVWYNLRDKLPEVAPGARSDPRPARARVKFHQTVVSGARDDSRPPQMIWSPEPAIEVPKPDAARLPNVLAVAPPARPQPRPFAVPPENRPKSAAAQLAEAPAMAAKPELRNLPLTTAGPRPQPLAFTLPPAIKRDRPATLVLPDAPVLEAAVKITGAPDLPLTAPMPRLQPKVFNAPPVRPLTEIAGSSRSGSADMDAPPATENRPLSAPGAIAGLARPFLAPPSAPRIERPPAALPAEAPAAGAASSQTASLASMAIVGLNPANTSVIPAPPAPRDGGFSAGPVVRPEGGSGSSSDARVTVPGLLVRGGVKDEQPALASSFSPTSRANLLAAARLSVGPAPGTRAPQPVEEPRATRVSSSPDPRMAGRMLYTVAIQMPNVTSYSGSWIVWFAVREPGPATGAGVPPEIRPPLPLRKVDPKYIQSAVSDRVEGKVLLSAVIRKDGHVEAVALLQQLDERLDRSAAEALAKWVFEPAVREGSPVDVDAVFEIPFHLAPKPAR